MNEIHIPDSLFKQLHTITLSQRSTPGTHAVEKNFLAVRTNEEVNGEEKVVGFVVQITADFSYWYFEDFDSAYSFFSKQ
jgi:hypothetical protein